MDLLQPTPRFLQWWYCPWQYAERELPGLGRSVLARRDAYRHWCELAQISPDPPAQADWHWQYALAQDGEHLLRAAELFGGLLAARRQRHEELAALDPARRRWCLSLALTQPLADWSTGLPQQPDSAGQRGLLEIALRLERALPGAWPRLSLMLPSSRRPLLEASAATSPTAGPVLRERDRRCWQICLDRAAV